MKETFGILPSGEAASLYTISCGGITAAVTDFGAALVRLLVPDQNGVCADVVVDYKECNRHPTDHFVSVHATVRCNENLLKSEP